MELISMLSEIAQEFLGAFLLDVTFLPIYIIAVHLIQGEYRKYDEYRENLLMKPAKMARRQLEESVFFGLVGGFAASVASVALNISIPSATYGYIFLALVLLLVIDLRLACFPYAAGIVILFNLLFNVGDIEAASLLMLAAILQMVESVLILLIGAKDAMPVYIKYGDGIAGAFLSRKFWPMPVVFFTFLLQEGNISGTGGFLAGSFPSKPEEMGAVALAMALDCMVMLAGYTDVAMTRTPERKSRETGILSLAYAVLLFGLGWMSRNIPALGLVGAIFAVVAREGLILYGFFREKNGIPLFEPEKRGLKVLDVLPGSHAEKMGIHRGDVILYINGKGVQTTEGMNSILKDFPTFIWVDVIKPGEGKKTYQYRCFPEGLGDLGIISVPREWEVTYNVDHFQRLLVLKNLVARFRNIDKLS